MEYAVHFERQLVQMRAPPLEEEAEGYLEPVQLPPQPVKLPPQHQLLASERYVPLASRAALAVHPAVLSASRAEAMLVFLRPLAPSLHSKMVTPP